MPDALSNIRTRTPRATPQRERARPDQVRNNGGGYVFKTSDADKIQRFLTLGTEGGTYYQHEQELTKDAARTVLAAAEQNGTWLVEKIREVSVAGRAPRQQPGLFALAAASGLGPVESRQAALAALPAVARTGSSLLTFVGYVENFRGWGRSLRTGIANWVNEKEPDPLAYQFVKYRQREGWSQRDVLRLAHPKPRLVEHNALYRWMTKHEVTDHTPAIVQAHVEAMAATHPATWIRLITQHRLPWEALPDAALKDPMVWQILIQQGMPQTALMRQLPRLTNLGVLKGETLGIVTAQLTDPERLRRGRVHPMNILTAMKTYASGRSMTGSNTWTPKRQVIDALDAAFYASFGTVEPAGKRTLLALDVSGSMGSSAGAPKVTGRGRMGGTQPITCREASAALALVTMASEQNTTVVGFTAGNGTSRNSGWGMPRAAITELGISPRQRLDDAVRTISGLPFGGTDCALPMLWAHQNRQQFDTFVILTDNESWAGDVQPMQALKRYRDYSGIDAKLIVVGLTATEFTIADPNDPGSLNVAGFDSSVPNLISDFSRGTL